MPFVGKKVGEIVNSIKADEIKFVSTVEQIWEVENFHEFTKGQTVFSPTFDGDSKGVNKWRMEVERKQDDQSPDIQDVEFGLVLVESESPLPITAEYQFSFLNSVNKILWTGDVQSCELTIDEQSYHTMSFKTIQSEYLIGGNTLRFHCQVSTTLNLKQKCEEEEFSVKKQFKSIFINGDFADVVLKTENTSFPASKLILSGHSPVFSAMFSTKMKEAIENTVQIKDFSDEVVKGCLEFMYTGETQILEENPAALLKISDKYQVMDLKKKAESVLLRKLTIHNAVEGLVLAHFHSPTILKPKVVAFVNRNSKDIQQTEVFKKMARNIPDILLDLYADVTSAEKQNKP